MRHGGARSSEGHVAIIAICLDDSHSVPTRLPHRAASPRSRAALVRRRASRADGCATARPPTCRCWRTFGVYKLDINQGNYLSQDMVDKLKVGHDAGSRCARCSARRWSPTPSGPTAGTTSTNTSARAGRSSIAIHRLFRRRQARALGRRRDAAVGGRAQSRRASDKALPTGAHGTRTWVVLRRSFKELFEVTDDRARRDRRRRRPHGPGADRGDRSRCDDLALAAALDVAGSPASARDAGERFGRATGVVVGSDVAAALRACRRPDRFHAARRARSLTSRPARGTASAPSSAPPASTPRRSGRSPARGSDPDRLARRT